MTFRKSLLGVGLALFGGAPAFAQHIAVVNGAPIPKARADALVAELVKQGQQDSPQLHAAVRDELISREVLMQEAVREGIPTRPDVKQQVAVAQQSVVLHALVEDFVQHHEPTDAQIRTAYEEFARNARGHEYHVHHILVDSESQARDLIAKIRAGAKFEDRAKQSSKDTGSGKNGGDLGWAKPDSYVPEFAQAVATVQKGGDD